MKTRASLRPWHLAAAAPLAMGLLVAVGACTTSDPGGAAAGSECFVATDCADGLVCVPQQGGGRTCSNDISKVAGKPPMTEEGGMAEAAADAPGDAPVTMDAPDDTATGQDTGGQDTGADAGAG